MVQDAEQFITIGCKYPQTGVPLHRQNKPFHHAKAKELAHSAERENGSIKYNIINFKTTRNMNATAIITIVAMSLVGCLFCVWMARHDNLEVK